MDKLWCIQRAEYYSLLKNNISSYEKTWRKFLTHITKWKESIWRPYIVWFQLYITGKGKTAETKRISSYQVFEGGRMNKQNSEGSEIILYENIVVDTCYYTFVQIHRSTTPRMNPNINYEHWATMMYPHRFTNGNKFTSLLWDFCSRRGCVYRGEGDLKGNFCDVCSILLWI